MDPADQRMFDKFAARVLRTSVLGVKRVTDVFRKRAQEIPETPARILVVKLWGLGALVWASPALRALRRRFPDAEITLLTRKGLETLYDATGLYDRSISWEAGTLGELPQAVRLFRDRVREPGFDVAVNFDGVSELAALLTHVSGAATTAGFVPQRGRRRGYTVPVVLDLGSHAGETFLDLAKAVGARPTEVTPVPPRLRRGEREQARATLRQWGGSPHTLLVGINMNASEFAMHRAWPGEKYVLLAQAIEEMGEYKTVFFGSPAEERFVSRHVKHMDSPPINLSGRTSVRQLAALLAELHLFITNDAGPLHLAAALGVPTVSIFGPESPERFGPPATEQHAVIWRKPACGPCLSFLQGRVRRCTHGEVCVREITLDQVRAAVQDMLEHLSDPEEPPWDRNADA